MSSSSKKPTRDWPALIKQARRGDDDALGIIVSIFHKYLTVMVDQEMGLNLRSKFSASDVVQQSMLEAHLSIGKFTGSTEAEIRQWLRQIVMNNLVDTARSFTKTLSRNSSLEIPLETISKSQQPVDPQTPSWRLKLDESGERLFQAVDRLPERQRHVVKARRQGLSNEKIASDMNISQDAVRKLHSRGVEQLRIWLGQQE